MVEPVPYKGLIQVQFLIPLPTRKREMLMRIILWGIAIAISLYIIARVIEFVLMFFGLLPPSRRL